jgi:hypothetical protein
MFWIYVSPSKSMLTFQSSHQLSNLLSNIKEIVKTITLQKYHWGIPTHFLLIHFKSERPWFRKLLVLKAWSLRASILNMTCVTYPNVMQICHTNEPILLRPSWHNGVIRYYIPQLSSIGNLHTFLRVQVQLLYFYKKNTPLMLIVLNNEMIL